MTLSEKLAYCRVVVPLLPMLLLTAILHTLGLLPTSSKWPLRMTLHVEAIRALTSPKRGPSPVSKIQNATLRDSGPSGQMWVSKASITARPAHEDPIRDVVFMAIKSLGNGSERYEKPFSEDIRVEWTGFREAARDGERLPADMDEKQRYDALMKEPSRTSDATILYFHGGAYYLCGLGTHRQTVSRLTKESAGRALAVEYRLAPQAAFPSQLIDALNAYIYLLYPPPGAFHEPVKASDIVFAGDSAGGNLAFALLQLLLEMHRCKPAGLDNPVIRYNDREVRVPLPAGVSACSGWFDVTRSMLSVSRNVDFDYLPPPVHEILSRLAPDHLWPTEPPRGDLFCDLSLLCHPLVSPIAALDWTGAPPMWISTGQEMLTDEDAFVAETARQAGVPVQYEQHEFMPHCAMILFADIPSSKRGLKSWGGFIRQCAGFSAKIETNGTLIQTSGHAGQIEGRFSELKREQVLALMRSVMELRLKSWEGERPRGRH